MHRSPVLPGEGNFVPAGPGDLAFQKWLQGSQWWPHERMLSHHAWPQSMQRLDRIIERCIAGFDAHKLPATQGTLA